MPGWVELLWDGKRLKPFTKESVDENYGPVREVKKIPLPFQKIELLGIDKKRSTPDMPFPLFPQDEWPKNYPKDWKNLLIWGDNKLAMSSLLQGIKINGETINLRGKIKLIYIDPPFATGADFSFKTPMPDAWKSFVEKLDMKKENKKNVVKNPSIMEEIAYRDMWGGRTPEERISSYLNYMYERLVLMKELLSNDGSIYVHLDYRMVHFVKLMMDEIFGRENFRNEIVWHYISGGLSEKTFGKKHDVILFYSKTNEYVFNQLRELKNKYKNIDSSKFLEDEKGKFVWYIRPGTNPKVPEGVKVYIEGIIHDVWDIPIVNPQAEERKFTGNYPTQKPEKLLERIILASSNEGDIVADFFCGSGTTAAVAEKLNRRWLCVDNNPKAFEVTKQRLSKIQPRLF